MTRPRVHSRATLRLLRCAICGDAVVVQSATSAHPEAPEMFQLPASAWIGLAAEDSGGVRVVVTCSDACLQGLSS